MPRFLQPLGGEEPSHDHRPEDVMKSSTRDNAEGKLLEMKGKVNEETKRSPVIQIWRPRVMPKK
ncbi:MAG: hypothetical protein ACSLFH_00560 [Desulfuromonadales bacterium]